ncbi:unnamed protein product [Aphanomyces euteiches]
MKTPSKKELIEKVKQYERMYQSPRQQATPEVVEQAPASVNYTHTMVVALLELRYNTYRTPFLQNRSSQLLGVLWENLCVKFNIACSLPYKVGVLSLKNKLQSLKKEYLAILSASKKTGNNTSDAIKFPSYWDELVVAFGDKRGLADTEFGSEDPTDVNEDFEPNESNDDTELKRKLNDQADVDRKRNNRKRSKLDKSSVAEGLATLGSTLAQGLVNAASIQRDQGTSETEMLEFMREVKASMDQNRVIQEQLLKLLQDKL